MADALVSSLIEQLISISRQEVEQEVRLVVGVDEDVKWLQTALEYIQLVLNDAEEKQVNNKAVKVWLEELRNVAYDMEDVLDEWSTEIHRSRIEGVDDACIRKTKVLISKLFCLCNSISQVSLRHDIGHKIKEIKGRLDVVAKNKDQLQLTTTTEEPPTFRMTSSMLDVLEVCGRDHDKYIILSKLLSESSQQEMPNVPVVISICGIGGIGKTTLAQMVFNDHEVKNHFEKTMWVCVSDPFDLTRLAKAIIQAAGEHVPNSIEWEPLHQKLYTSITGKRFLLVLDDVWTEDHTKWSPLKLALNGGAQGSRIVVTTRSEKVALMIGSAYTHDLGQLSEDECWLLFKRIVLQGRSKEECEKLEDIGKDIIKKCKGVPLFVKTLGSLMLFKRTRREWVQVLESNAWELQEVEKGVLPALLLSYYALPSNVKRCFTYCAIFPKDQRIKKDELIKLWMSQGLLNSMGRRDLEVVGTEYFDELLMRSFFQRDRNTFYYKMHDLIHDFAQFLTKTECFIMDDNNTEFNNNSKKVRHLNVTKFTNLISILPSIYEAKNLRTLIIDGDPRRSHYVPALSNLFCQLTCLRELSMRNLHVGELPNEVEKLIHLRYFDLSGTRLKELPKIMSRLYNLQTLKLNHCSSLCKLPQGIEKMINLRHLEIKETDELSYLPQGIGRLSSLRKLTLLNLPKLQVLPALGNLPVLESLSIGAMKSVKRVGVEFLGINVDVDDDGTKRGGGESRVVVAFPQLKVLNIQRMDELEEWEMLTREEEEEEEEHAAGSGGGRDIIIIMPLLHSLFLRDCPKLKELPHYIFPASLRILRIGYCPKLSWTPCLPPLLEELRLGEDVGVLSRSLPTNQVNNSNNNLKSLIIVSSKHSSLPEGLAHLTSLQSLSIWHSDSLMCMSKEVKQLTSLQYLNIDSCSVLGARCQKEVGEDWSIISHIPNIEINRINVRGEPRMHHDSTEI